MSKKYVPSFLKDQQQSVSAPTTNNTTSWPAQRNTTTQNNDSSYRPFNMNNKFSALSDDFEMNKKDKPIVNTSLPAREAPKLAPATLASLTSNGSGDGPKKSFASKFAEQVKIANNPNYVPPPKPVNLTSEDDFPSLGAPKKPMAAPTKTVTASSPETTPAAGATKFADLARGWAKQKEDEEEKARLKAIKDEERRREMSLMRNINILGFRRRQALYGEDEEDEDDYNYQNDGSSLGDDSYEIPEEDAVPSEEDEEEDENEFNQNVGWDGRRKDDLY
jgi:hypothetical protein